MAAEPFANTAIFDTNTAQFATAVIERSRSTAIAVDFWAPWCGPCRALAPILEQLVQHYAGRLLLARVNTDEEPALAAQFGIRSIPDVRIFRDGRMVDGFVGVQPASRLQTVFDRHVARPSEGLRTQARARLEAGDVAAAAELLRQLLRDDPQNHPGRIDLADALARLDEFDVAERLLNELPANASTGAEVDRVRARIELLRNAPPETEVAELHRRVSGANADLEAMHRLALHEITAGDPSRGLQLLLDIMRRDRRFGDGLGRRRLLQAFQLLGENDERVAEYRRKMTALLY